MHSYIHIYICLPAVFLPTLCCPVGFDTALRPLACTTSPVSRQQRRPYKMSESICINTRAAAVNPTDISKHTELHFFHQCQRRAGRTHSLGHQKVGTNFHLFPDVSQTHTNTFIFSQFTLSVNIING